MKIVIFNILFLLQILPSFITNERNDRDNKMSFLIVNAQYFRENSDTLKIFRENLSNPILEMTNNHLIFYNDTCCYLSNYCDFFDKDDVLLALDYDIFIFKNVTLKDNGYFVNINNEVYFVPFQNGAYSESIEKHMKNSIIIPKKGVLLKQDPDINSPIIDANKENHYFVVKIVKDWILLETPEEFDKIERGWVKYIDNDTLNIELFYSY